MVLLDYFPVPLCTSLQEFLIKVIRQEDGSFPIGHPLCMKLFPLLVAGGCDFYDMLSLYSEIQQLTETELETLVALSPEPGEELPVKKITVRGCIPRWTSSQYSSGAISEVVDSVLKLLTNQTMGVIIYNSNLNPRNKRAVNDRYILIITKSDRRFYDINRRRTYSFQKAGRGSADDTNCTM